MISDVQESAEAGATSSGVTHRRLARGLVMLVAGLLVAEIVVVAASVSWEPLRHQILLSVTQRPTPLTEVFFSSYPPPGQMLRVGSQYSFSFDIHNVSSTRRPYQPDITIRSGGEVQTIPEPVSAVAAGHTTTRSVTFTPTAAARGSFCVVTVTVDNRTIRFANPVR